ncbi:hypothetical protein GW17_00014437 [Ensete ventricosum]|nr:hypothetical protein GW17_00014437 [Ensete ventricosum]
MLLKVFPDDDLGSTAHDRKEQEKGIYMTPIAMMSSISMLALLERGNVFVLGADTSRVGIGVEIGPPIGYYAYVTYGGGRRGGGKGCSQQPFGSSEALENLFWTESPLNLFRERKPFGSSEVLEKTCLGLRALWSRGLPDSLKVASGGLHRDLGHAQMKRVQVLKFDLEGALTKGGEVEDLSLADEDRVGKGRGQLSRSFGSGLGTYWW